MRKVTQSLSGFLSIVASLCWAAPNVTVDASLGTSNPFNNEYVTINEGIAAVDAGGTVNVLPGVYNENVFITKSLALVGDPGDAAAGPGASAPVIDGRAPVQLPNATAGIHIGMQSDGTFVAVSDVTISGFVIRNIGQYDTVPNTSGEDGIRIDAGTLTANNVTINDNEIDTTGAAAIFASNADGVNNGLIIRNNLITGNHGGRGAVDVNNTSNVDVDANELDGFRNGIVVSAIDSMTNSGLSVANLTVRRNVLRNFLFTAAATPSIIRIFSEDADFFSPDLQVTGISVLENDIDMTGTSNTPAAINVAGPLAVGSANPSAPQNALIFDNTIISPDAALICSGVGDPLVIRGNDIDFVGGPANQLLAVNFGSSVIILENEIDIISQDISGFGLADILTVTLNNGPVSIIGNRLDGNRADNPEVRLINVTSPFNPVVIANNDLREAEEAISIGDGTQVVIVSNTFEDTPSDIVHNSLSNATVEEDNNFFPDNDSSFDPGSPITVGTESDGTNLDDDADNDLLTDATEISLGTSPNNPDSDGDGIEDGVELFQGTDPTTPDTVADADNDGLIDSLDPDNTTPDSDGDGYQDFFERLEGTDPALASSFPDFGDINQDTVTDNVDAILILEVFLGLSDATLREADMNRDGAIDNVDAVILFNFFLGNLPYLPFP